MKIKKKSSKKDANLLFERAVSNTNDIQNCIQTGLRALGNYSSKVVLGNQFHCNGSVDLDSCVRMIYPNDYRWDYMVSYDNEVFFIEVHSANTSQVKVVLRKLQWLKDWLINSAPEIYRLRAKSKHPYYWIQTNGFAIPKHAPQYRQIKQSGIYPIRTLKLP